LLELWNRLFQGPSEVLGIEIVWEESIIQESEQRVEGALMDVDLFAVRMLETVRPLMVDLLRVVVGVRGVRSQIEQTIHVEVDETTADLGSRGQG
jgi:hypothetical protein